MHYYFDVERLLVKYVINKIPIYEDNLKEFMRGFTQAESGPLFDIVDVGDNEEGMFRKMDGLLSLLAATPYFAN